jgi:dimethylaniline monooxygenase (N-oxide forming)
MSTKMRETYAFSDFPYPETADEFLTAEQVRAYLEAYTRHFSLHGHIRLNTKVVSVAREPVDDRSQVLFRVESRPTDASGRPETLSFDFVAVCNGVFCEPWMPEAEGIEHFAGRVLHSSQFNDPTLVAGKRVIVVGAGKSALDCATSVAQHAQTCTLVFRTSYWMVPRYFFSRVRMDRLLMTRFSELLLRYHRLSRAKALLHGPGQGLVRLFWRGQSRLIVRMLKIPPALVPEAPLPSGFERSGVGGECYPLLQQGAIIPKRARIAAITGATTVDLDSGERIDADAVIFATGWRQDMAFLDPKLRGRIQQHGVFQLYRHILPPAEPQLGFIGYASSIACQFTSEIAAHWLSQVFRGELALPNRAGMEQEIAWVRQWTTPRYFPRAWACAQCAPATS